MGLLWRLLAPRGLKKARRAMHPGWIIEDAIVHSVRGSGRKRARPKPKAETYTATLRITAADTGQVRELSCPHSHRTPETARECGERLWREWHREHPADKLTG